MDKTKKNLTNQPPYSTIRHSETGRRILLKSFYSALIAVAITLLFATPIGRVYNWVQTALSDEEKTEARLEEKLQAYIEGNHLSIGDSGQIEKWEAENHMRIRLLGTKEELDWQREFAAKYPGSMTTVKNQQKYVSQAVCLTFSDGTLWAYLEKEPIPWYRRGNIVVMVLLLIFIYSMAMLILMRDDIEYMIYLRDELNIMSGGDLTHEIKGYGKTELGQIGEGINELRKSVAGQIEQEYRALTANKELVTAMSHDLRTPLTRQIGYLEILHLKKYDSEEQRDQYIQKARSNAFLMKETTDKLFRYFLAFDHPQQKEKMLEVDGRVLLNHALKEQADYLKSQQFTVLLSPIEQPIRMVVDAEDFARVFDNLFQNIKKYGDPSQPVVILSECGTEELLLSIRNGIRKDTSKVESTRIGLKIVQKIMQEMNGSMTVSGDADVFEVQLKFKIFLKEEETA